MTPDAREIEVPMEFGVKRVRNFAGKDKVDYSIKGKQLIITLPDKVDDVDHIVEVELK